MTLQEVYSEKKNCNETFKGVLGEKPSRKIVLKSSEENFKRWKNTVNVFCDNSILTNGTLGYIRRQMFLEEVVVQREDKLPIIIQETEEQKKGKSIKN